MRILNQTRTVVLSSTPWRTVEARVRVRGIDVSTAFPRAMRALMGIAEDRRGIHVERKDPVEVIVREAGTERRHRIAGPSESGMAMLFVAAPIAARAITRMLKPKRSK
jgi:hypothetical protein